MVPSFPVSVRLSVAGEAIDEEHVFSPGTWATAASEALLQRDLLLGRGRCIINPTVQAETVSPVEHVVPQGTGIRWIKLPRGATASATNRRASSWERALLRDGLMGMLRPFYVTEKKSIAFTDSGGRRVVFRNDPAFGFVMETHDLPEITSGQGGPGTMKFSLPVRHASTLDVSRALYKSAYLCLAVLRPRVALSASFDPVREYLSNQTPTYRVYAERFHEGASPGVSAKFYIAGQELSDGTFACSLALAILRIHHASYIVPLLGDSPHSDVPGVQWFLEDVPPGVRNVELSFAFDSIEPGTV